jgi:hypothetical protein
MTQQIYVGGRRSGKTTMMILWYRAHPGAKIVVAHGDRKNHLIGAYGIPREDILTYQQVRYGGLQGIRGPVGFEDLDTLLREAWFDLIRGLRPEQIGPASFDTSVFDPIFHFTFLDPAAMEHVNAELRHEVYYEKERKYAERQATVPTRHNEQVHDGLPGGEG